MKQLVLPVLCILPVLAFAQGKAAKPVLKTKTIYLNKKLAGIEVYDTTGKLVFFKNDGMNGPITMISYSEYDRLNRAVRITSVHSNIGYSLSEYIYQGNYIFQYNSLDDSLVADTFSRDYLGRVKSAEDFMALNSVRQLTARKKRLLSVNEVDGAGNVITEMYISEKGDTTSINRNRYNEHNKNTWFHMGSLDDETSRYDIYYVYDDRSNLIKSFRVSDHAMKDTTEVYHYKYNSRSQLLSDDYYYKDRFRCRTDYYYNGRQMLVKALFYEDEEFVVDAVTTYKYDSKGNLSEKKVINNRGQQGDRKELYNYFYVYW